jgi:hypothetical protein
MRTEATRWIKSTIFPEMEFVSRIQPDPSPTAVVVAQVVKGNRKDCIVVPLADWPEIARAVEEMKEELGIL